MSEQKFPRGIQWSRSGLDTVISILLSQVYIWKVLFLEKMAFPVSAKGT